MGVSDIKISKFDIYVGTYAALLVSVGGLSYGDTDVEAFLTGAMAVTSGMELYTLHHAAYTPLPYLLFRAMLMPLTLLEIPVKTPTYLSVLALKALFVSALVIAVYLPTDVNRRYWAVIVLGTPLSIYFTGFFGQSDGLTALAVVAALVGVRQQRYVLAGAAVAAAASLKLYPIVMGVVLITRYRAHWREVLFGALPIACLNVGLLIGMIPHSVEAALDTSHPFLLKDRPISTNSAQHLVAMVLGPDITESLHLFSVSTTIVTAWAIWDDFSPEEIALVLPMLPAMIIHQYNPFYRWLPVVLGLGYCALLGDRRLKMAVTALLSILSVPSLVFIMLIPIAKMPNFVGSFDPRAAEVVVKPIFASPAWVLVTIGLTVTVLWISVTARSSRPYVQLKNTFTWQRE